MRNISFILMFCFISFDTIAQELEPVEENEVGIVETLPSAYPDHWIYAHKNGFPQGGRLMIVDITAEKQRYKGAVSAGYNGDVIINNERGEFYISETYYSRGSRGQRNDMITVYDQETLMAKAEISLEVGKRFLVSPMSGKFGFTNDKKWALVANYTPAASVSIVDLETHEILNEIPIPGCNLAYPLGNRGFATTCGYGEIISVELDENGNSIAEHQSEVYNDLDNDPHFEKTARVGDTVYFPTFMGNITPVDLSGKVAVIGKTWSLVSDAERAQGWRPGGWQLISSDRHGNIYITMHEKGYNGSHKEPGSEVWVFDPTSKTRIARHKLDVASGTIIVTNEEEPHLVTAGAFGSDLGSDVLMVYVAKSGEFLHKILVGDGVGYFYKANGK
jgi:methylamine dehydrogenase heavy chain